MMLLAFSAPVRADDLDGWHFTSALDILTVGNLGKHELAAGQKFCNAQVAAGATSCSGTAKTSGAFGGRLGAHYRSGHAYLGPTIGFLSGGPTAGKLSVATIPAGTLTRKTAETTGRFLLEFGSDVALNDYWALGIAAGVGAALVSEKNTCSDSGTLAGTCASSGYTSSVSRGWETWELGPSVQYRSLQFGFRYIGFARKKYAPWSTFGLFVGYSP